MSKLSHIIDAKKSTMQELVTWWNLNNKRQLKSFKNLAEAVRRVVETQEAVLEMDASSRPSAGVVKKQTRELVAAILKRDKKQDKDLLAKRSLPELKGLFASLTLDEPDAVAEKPARAKKEKAPKKETKPAAVALTKKEDGKGYTDGEKSWHLREKSDVRKPCDVARCIFADPDNKGKERKDLIALCVKSGVNISTAKTQFSWYQRKLKTEAATAAGVETEEEGEE